MPSAARSMPRMLLPPPTTRAISTPARCTDTISPASDSMCSWSMPNSRSPLSASPESLSKTRENAASETGWGSALMALLCQGEARELDDLEAGLPENVPDALVGVVDPRLLGEHVALEPLVEPALHDLLADLLGLVGHGLLLREDLTLGIGLRLRDGVARHVDRGSRSDVHGHLVRKVGRALRVQEHAELVRGRVDVRGKDLVLGAFVARGADDGDVLAEA